MTDLRNDEFLEQYFLDHQGVKGMKWGVRKKAVRSSSVGGEPSKKDAKKEVREVSGKAREIIREARRADTPSARKKAADRYEKEVLNPIKSPEFKKSFNKMNKTSKGEVAAHLLLLGPFAALSLPALKNAKKGAYDMEVDMAHDILRELRKP